MLACDVLINKLADWPPSYHRTARTFSKIFFSPHSMNNLALNKSVITEKQHLSNSNVLLLESIWSLWGEL